MTIGKAALWSLMILLVGGAVVIGGMCLYLEMATPDPVTEVHEEILSPDGARKIVIFSKDSGVGSNFNTQIAILKTEEGLGKEEAGLAFVSDQGDVRASWKDAGTVVVAMAKETRVFREDKQVGGVTVDYLREK